MAPALTSNSFLLTTSPHSQSALKNRRLTVFAKKAGQFPAFRLGKPADGEGESNGSSASNSSPFRFNFGGIPDVKTLVPVGSEPSSGLSFGNIRRKDPGTVFVAGATGQAGIRIAQRLLREGFRVRAGVPELGPAQELARLAVQYKVISNEESKRLNAVESSYEDAQSIAKAIGNAGKVVVTIGPAESGPTTQVTTSDALQVIQAANLAGVSHVAIIYDGSTATASTYNVLDGISSFFSNLFSQSQPLSIGEFLQKVVETDVNYTLVKTRLTDDYSPESSYNVVVKAEGSGGAYDYKVANSQIASLVAGVFSNTAVAENKVVNVYADPSAPSKTTNELFSAIPEDGRRKAYAEAIVKAKAEEEAAAAAKAKAAQEATEEAAKLEEVKKISDEEVQAASLVKEAQEKAEAIGLSMEGLFNRAKDLGSGLSFNKLSSQLSNAVQNPTEKPKVQVATVRGQARARSLLSQRAVVKPPPTPKPKPRSWPIAFKQKEDLSQKPAKDEPKKEVRKVFGGLFQQETIYVDDD